jgi:hypothetical protein
MCGLLVCALMCRLVYLPKAPSALLSLPNAIVIAASLCKELLLVCLLLCVLTVDIGLSLFCSFVQKRVAQIAASYTLAVALLFYRCRLLNNNPYAEFLER